MAGALPEESEPAARPGSLLGGKYRIERELARGGMGTVLIATHLKLDRLVAIKLVRTAGQDKDYVAARFLREARAAARLVGDHTVRILDLDETPDGTPYLVMELLEGVDLEGLLKTEGAIAPARAVDFALQICTALAEAHARGVVHRDVKPSNLFLVKRPDGSELIKLLDFGISKRVDEQVHLTRTAAAIGSPLFMSPEQLLSPRLVDRRSDVWSLGVTLYRLLSNQVPFDAPDASSVAAQIAASPPTPLDRVAGKVDPSLRAVVMTCLEKDPALRWSSAVALAEALEPFRAPGGLGNTLSVRLADAQGKLLQAAQPVVIPDASKRAATWTMSHDLPHGHDQLPMAQPAPSAPLTPVVARIARTQEPDAPSPRSGRAALGLAAALLVAGVGAYFTFGASPPKIEPTAVAAPARVEPERAEPVQVAVPAVERAALPLFDAGLAIHPRPLRAPGNDPRDPSDLELK